MAKPYRYDPWRLLKIGLIILTATFVVSTGIYYLLGMYYGENWKLIDCVFMVSITLSTIGYGDWLNLHAKPLAMLFTMVLAGIGVGIPAFLISTVTAMFVDGTVSDTVRRKRMQQEIAKLKGHDIVCGAGEIGEHCIDELLKLGRKVVAVDRDAARLKALQQQLGDFLYVVGNADEDNTLLDAGIRNAGFLVACITDDKDNLFITLSAKVLNPDIRIASKGIDEHVRKKMLIAGAAAVVSPTVIGGLRLVSELIRPVTTTFLDGMLRDKAGVRFGELTVGNGSKLAGRRLAQAGIREHADVLVVAAREPNADQFTYNPKGTYELRAGSTLVLLGASAEIERLKPLFY